MASFIMSQFPISPSVVRYVKLGSQGKWESECRAKGILRFGFDTADPQTMDWCRTGNWNKVAEDWQEFRGSKGSGTRDANAIQCYWSDPGNVLWITFIGEDLCWGFLEPGEPVRYDLADPEQSTFRKVAGGWCSVDAQGIRLGKYNLPGYITKVAAFRSTVCSVEGSDRLVARINGTNPPDIERVALAQSVLREALVPLIRSLNANAFEVLIDMMFARGGWRRIGYVGKTQRDKDLDLEMPLTRERAVVQVKTGTSQDDLDDYVQRKQGIMAYDRLFFIYHTSKVPLIAPAQEDITVLDAFGVAERVVEMGLVDWVLNQV